MAVRLFSPCFGPRILVHFLAFVDCVFSGVGGAHNVFLAPPFFFRLGSLSLSFSLYSLSVLCVFLKYILFNGIGLCVAIGSELKPLLRDCFVQQRPQCVPNASAPPYGSTKGANPNNTFQTTHSQIPSHTYIYKKCFLWQLKKKQEFSSADNNNELYFNLNQEEAGLVAECITTWQTEDTQ